MQTMEERNSEFVGSMMFDEVDRILATIESRLPALPAAGIKMQRAINGRMRDVMEEAVGRFGGVAERTTDTAEEIADEVSATADEVADEVDETAAEAKGSVAQTIADTADAIDRAAETVAPDYDELTKAELYDIAQRRDLDGRSTMNKAELVEALRSSD